MLELTSALRDLTNNYILHIYTISNNASPSLKTYILGSIQTPTLF